MPNVHRKPVVLGAAAGAVVGAATGASVRIRQAHAAGEKAGLKSVAKSATKGAAFGAALGGAAGSLPQIAEVVSTARVQVQRAATLGWDAVGSARAVSEEPVKGPKWRTRPLEHRFATESVTPYSDWGTTVKYFNDQERQAYKLTFKKGKIYDARGELFDTTGHKGPYNLRSNAIFVMDEHGNVYASPEQKVGVFQHSSFLAGGEVAASGEIHVVNGVLTSLTDQSGHYPCEVDMTAQFVRQLEDSGIDLKNVPFTGVRGGPAWASDLGRRAG